MEELKVEIAVDLESKLTNDLGRELKKSQYGNSEQKEVIISYIKELWGKDAPRALEIFYCESGFQEKVISRTNDVGVAQINLAAHWSKIKGATRAEKIANLQGYKYNLDFAFALWKAQSWQPWVCSRVRNYK